MKIQWDGKIPERRYAVFKDHLCQNVGVVVTGNDILTAPKWGNFVKWIGGLRPAETRKVKNR
jgi:hypothetical protein